MFRRRNSMQASLTLALAVAVAGIMISSLPGVHSKGSKGKAKVGNVECPCFCSQRSGGAFSPYWDDEFGDPEEDGPRCAYSCIDVDDPQHVRFNSSSFCSQFVDYNYCPRIVDDRQIMATSQLHQNWLDDHARNCASQLPWDDEDCVHAVNSGACFVVFPKCGSDSLPQATYEVSICRVTDSAFGPANVILENCESAGTENYVMEDGPSDTCTGAGSATAPASLVTVAAALVAVAAMASL